MSTNSGIVVLLALLVWASTGLGATYDRTMVCDELTRTYRVHVPDSYDPNQATPLVIALPGYGNDYHWMEERTRFSILSDRDGFIVVYPEGLPLGPAGERQWVWGGTFELGIGYGDDVHFVTKLMALLTREYTIDRQRIYAMGWSNGGFFAHYLGATMPGTFAAIAPCGAYLNAADLIPGAPPQAIIMIHGDQDSAVSFAAAASSAPVWAQHNGCAPDPQVIRDDDLAEVLAWSRPDGAGDVTFYHLKGWGHRIRNENGVWPGELIWEFFQTHPAQTPTQAWNPQPAPGVATVDPWTADLAWSAGQVDDQPCTMHHLYIGTDFAAVQAGTEPHEIITDDASVSPAPLAYGQVYYWRVDEVYGPAPERIVTGPVWQFTTADYRTIDDFEGYDEDVSHPMGDTWTDGISITGNGALLGSYALVAGTAFDGGQAMPVLYDNQGGYSEVKRMLRQDWAASDANRLSLHFKGFGATHSSFSEGPAGTCTVSGRGRDIYDTRDQCTFVYKEITGTTSITAKIESLDPVDPWAKAGIMIRDTLDTDARYVGIFATAERAGWFHLRGAAGAYTARETLDGLEAPYWIKLERLAPGVVKVYHSPDGQTWTRVYKQLPSDMPMYVGLAVASHDAGVLCRAEFSNVTVTGAGSDAAWRVQDVGMIINDPLPLYVTLNGMGTVYHDNPQAALIDQWTEWRIDLQAFSEQGVDLTDIRSLTLGIGRADGAASDSTGLVFFDALRLYQP